jgi:purine-nucleoside phosphorylase
MKARLDAAIGSLAGRVENLVDLGVVLGSGLGDLAAATRDPVTVPYAEIAGLPVSKAPGHAGRLVVGELFGRRVAILQGRVHLYEGWSAQDVALPIYLLRSLGARTLVITNAAGALDPDYAPGDAMLIEDHLNFTGATPLTGPNEDRLGPRFPDMSRPYDPELRALALAAASEVGEPLRRGIYAGVAGPALETSAERRFLRGAGADAVGMSTVLEVIAAAHAGFRTLGLSAITNRATGGPDQQVDTIEDVLANAQTAGRRIAAILAALLLKL